MKTETIHSFLSVNVKVDRISFTFEMRKKTIHSHDDFLFRLISEMREKGSLLMEIYEIVYYTL
jgi:hypothetical protein